MKKNLYQIAIGIIIFSVWGCEKNDKDDARNGNGTASGVIELKGKFLSYAYTDNPKDDQDAWFSNQIAGIFMLKENTSELIVNQSNIPYKSAPTKGAFQPVNPDNVLALAGDNTSVNVVAYTPWKENLINNRLPINCTDQSDNLFVYYATAARGLNKNQLKAELEFRPVLVKANFILQAGLGVPLEKLERAKIDILGMNVEAKLNLLNGQLEEITTPAPISITCNEENKAAAIILPTDGVKDYALKITLPAMNDETREWEFSQGDIIRLNKGMEYTFTVTILPGSIDVQTDEKPIGDWETGDSSSGNRGEDNLVKWDINEIATGDVKTVTKLFGETSNGEWFCFFNGGQKGFSKVVNEVGNGKAIYTKIETATKDWWNVRTGYHMQATNVLSQKYILECKVKGTKGGKLWMCINGNKLGDTSSFMAAKVEGGDAYGGHNVTLTESYTSVKNEFDFSRTSKQLTWKSPVLSSINEERTDFSIAFYLENSVGEYYIKDLKLYRKSE